MKNWVLKSGENQVESFGKEGVVDIWNGEGDDKLCGDRKRK